MKLPEGSQEVNKGDTISNSKQSSKLKRVSLILAVLVGLISILLLGIGSLFGILGLFFDDSGVNPGTIELEFLGIPLLLVILSIIAARCGCEKHPSSIKCISGYC